MIKYVKRKDLDVLKYDDCIENALNSRIYAFSYYLDIVADNWSVLILNDYEAVMPLPWRSKYFIKYIYPPCWTQQLGVFSSKNISFHLVKDFIKSIPGSFLKISTQLNNECNSDLFSEKNNFILDLNQPYENIHKNYKKGRKYTLKKFIKSEFTTEQNIDVEKIICLFRKNYKDELDIKLQDYIKLEKLALEKKLDPITIGVFDDDHNLISGSLFFKDKYRIYYVFSANNEKGNKIQGNTAILNHIIKLYADTNYILDFEGSMHPGIASFFKSFGSRIENYFLFTNKVFIDLFLSKTKK